MLDKYICYIKEEEVIYNHVLMDHLNIRNKKNDAMDILYAFIHHLHIEKELKEYYLKVEFIQYIITQLDWYNYITTTDCQSGTFLILKELCYQAILQQIQEASLRKDVEILQVKDEYVRTLFKYIISAVIISLKNCGIFESYFKLRYNEIKNFLEGLMENRKNRTFLKYPLVRVSIKYFLDLLISHELINLY